MDYSALIAILIILGVCAFLCYALRHEEAKPKVILVEDGFKPEAEIGTFRIIPNTKDLTIRVQRYLKRYYDDHNLTHPCWRDIDEHGFQYHHSLYSHTIPEFKTKTEKEAEEFIKKILDREEISRKKAEEDEIRRKTFEEEHPIRTIPPYKYLS